MPSQRTYMVTSVAVEPGVRIAASWDGGRLISVHVDRDGITQRVAVWPVWNFAWDAPLIAPTIESFERFVRGRLEEPGTVDELVGTAAA